MGLVVERSGRAHVLRGSRVSSCSLDYTGGRWYLGLGGGAALMIEGQARSSGVQPMGCVRGVPGSLRTAGESLEALPAPGAAALPAVLS